MTKTRRRRGHWLCALISPLYMFVGVVLTCGKGRICGYVGRRLPWTSGAGYCCRVWDVEFEYTEEVVKGEEGEGSCCCVCPFLFSCFVFLFFLCTPSWMVTFFDPSSSLSHPNHLFDLFTLIICYTFFAYLSYPLPFNLLSTCAKVLLTYSASLVRFSLLAFLGLFHRSTN